eukprot:UN23405
MKQDKLCDDVPHVVHQTWKAHSLPPQSEDFRNTWLDHHDESWSFHVWNDTENRLLIQNVFPWFLCVYDMYDVPVKRADAIRPFYMLYYGGIYSDFDVEVIKPFDDLIAGKHAILPVMGNDTTWLLDRHGITNMFLRVYLVMNIGFI